MRKESVRVRVRVGLFQVRGLRFVSGHGALVWHLGFIAPFFFGGFTKDYLLAVGTVVVSLGVTDLRLPIHHGWTNASASGLVKYVAWKVTEARTCKRSCSCCRQTLESRGKGERREGSVVLARCGPLLAVSHEALDVRKTINKSSRCLWSDSDAVLFPPPPQSFTYTMSHEFSQSLHVHQTSAFCRARQDSQQSIVYKLIDTAASNHASNPSTNSNPQEASQSTRFRVAGCRCTRSLLDTTNVVRPGFLS